MHFYAITAKPLALASLFCRFNVTKGYGFITPDAGES